ncbi:MAG TPA: glycosyltransferase [Solirubrobacteraceae bacterium]|jgi:glycosyltransferase involved in cell wall biosynthesis|nr:glycosyltransferase [Solirubrobacteraceae bacterium]
MTTDIYAIVTAYNEAERISATLATLATTFPGARLIVGDDGSSDATCELARASGARVVRSERVIGKGGAATLAAEAALREAGESESGGGRAIFLLCDGDLGESARSLAALTGAVEHGRADVAVAVFATRVGGGLGIALGFARWAIRRRCGLETVAPISGQRALSPRALAAVLPFAHGFGMEVGMTIDAVRAGYRVAELQLELSHRASGRTLAGFAHRGRQLADFARAYLARGRFGRGGLARGRLARR